MFGTTPESERTGENGPALLGTEQTISTPPEGRIAADQPEGGEGFS